MNSNEMRRVIQELTQERDELKKQLVEYEPPESVEAEKTEEINSSEKDTDPFEDDDEVALP